MAIETGLRMCHHGFVKSSETQDTLSQSIYLEKVERARRMTPGERLVAGIELFEESAGRMKVGIRLRHPDAHELEVDRILHQQLARMKAWHEEGLYQPGSEA